MKRFISVFAIFLFSINVYSEDTRAIDSAMRWLSVIDSGEYAKSWDHAAPFFKEQLSSDQWVDALNQVRKPLGKAKLRALNSATPHSSLPNALDGEYMVITLVTDFDNKPTSIETVTFVKYELEWRAVGYFIK